jgi:hypothetical protein
MQDRQIISVQEVRGLALAIFDRLLASGIETVTIGQPVYWSVFPTEVFSVQKPDLVLSDVADDLEDLRAETRDADSPLSLGFPWHALHHFAGICSAMAAGTMDQSHNLKDAEAERDVS